MLDQIHYYCRALKDFLDGFPEGSNGALLFAAATLQAWLESTKLMAWARDRVSSTLISQLVKRGPVVILTTLWGWATLGSWDNGVALKGFAVGVLAPILRELIFRKPKDPPSSGGATKLAAALALMAIGCSLPPVRLTPEQKDCQKAARIEQAKAFAFCLAEEKLGNSECSDGALDTIEHNYCAALVVCVGGDPESECAQ